MQIPWQDLIWSFLIFLSLVFVVLMLLPLFKKKPESNLKPVVTKAPRKPEISARQREKIDALVESYRQMLLELVANTSIMESSKPTKKGKKNGR